MLAHFYTKEPAVVVSGSFFSEVLTPDGPFLSTGGVCAPLKETKGKARYCHPAA